MTSKVYRTEFCALDAHAFDAMRGKGFKNLVKVLVEVGRVTSKSMFELADILSHPKTVITTAHGTNRF